MEPGTRDEILDAAERHFAERGFDGASVREICADAGLKNQASLYHYFANKQQLYEAVLRRGVESLLAVVVEGRAAGVARDGASGGMNAYLDRTMDYLIAHQHLARLIQRASIDDSDSARAIVAQLARPLYEEGVHLLAGVPTAWPADQLPYLAAGLYHLIFGYFADTALLRAVMRDDPSSAAAIARQRAFVQRAVSVLVGAE
jgi:AcrR family transcriptional regulator